MIKRLKTDLDFEKAHLSHATVCVTDRSEDEGHYIGGLDGFTTVFVRVGGRLFVREDCEFAVIR